MNSMIHRGIEGYFQYEEGKIQELVNNIKNVIE